MRNKIKLVSGIGINDADYKVYKYSDNKLISVCPFYLRWKSMIDRCYSKKRLSSRPSYQECLVCEEWLTFSNFKAWMEQQDWDGRHLDKDLLSKEGKVYGPDTCVFIDKNINLFLIDSSSKRGEWPIGVDYVESKKKFRSVCHCVVTNKKKFLGYFDNPQEAHLKWVDFKFEQAVILATSQPDERVAKALIERFSI